MLNRAGLLETSEVVVYCVYVCIIASVNWNFVSDKL